MAKKIAAPAYDWKVEAREQFAGLGIEALEAFVAHHTQQANVEAFMARGFSMSAEAMERHVQKIKIASDVLAQRMASAQNMVQAAFAQAA